MTTCDCGSCGPSTGNFANPDASRNGMLAPKWAMLSSCNSGSAILPGDGLSGSYAGPVLGLYRKREGARRAHVHGVFARFRYKSASGRCTEFSEFHLDI